MCIIRKRFFSNKRQKTAFFGFGQDCCIFTLMTLFAAVVCYSPMGDANGLSMAAVGLCPRTL